MSVADLAEALNVSQRHIWKMLADGRLGVQPFRLGRAVRFHRGSVEKWLAAREQAERKAAEWRTRGPFLKLRFHGHEIPDVARKLDCDEGLLRKWEKETREDANSWNEAFLYLHTSDPVSWALYTADRFYELWGRKGEE